MKMKQKLSTSHGFLSPVSLCLAMTIALTAFLASSLPVMAQESRFSSGAQSAYGAENDIWALARGGQLYDNWALVLDADPPTTTHPAYPSIGKKKGKATWRCKECHGWDYKGEDGVYGKGAHYTGIKGIRRMIGVDPGKIIKILRDDTHQYTEKMLPEKSMQNIALFVSSGQIDMDQYIDRATRKAHGSLRRGASFFQTVCAICHGFDGAAMDSKSETYLAAFGDKGLMGTLASDNPWEVLHKIRNGQPGVGMVALRVLSIQDQVDVLAYAQTLVRRRYNQ